MHLGNKHDYLRMDFDFMNNGSLEVSILKYLDSSIDELPELITGKAATPAADHLFSRRELTKQNTYQKISLLHFTIPPLSYCS